MKHVSGRLIWLDYAKGIGIFLVVLIHTMRGLRDAGLFPYGPVSAYVDYITYTFHMPLFLFLSGLFLPRALARGPGDYVEHRLRRIYHPYLVWSVLQAGVMLVLARHTNHPIGIETLLLVPVVPFMQFWFLWALTLFGLVALAVRRVDILLAIGIAAFAASHFIALETPPWKAAYYMLYFVLGAFAADRAFLSFHRPWLAALLGAAFLAAASLAYASGAYYSGIVALPAALLGTAATIAVSRQLEVSRLPLGFLAYLGQLSLAIYVMHILAASAMRTVILKSGIGAEPDVALALCVAAGVLIPVLAYEVLRRLHCLALFGLDPPARVPAAGQTPPVASEARKLSSV